MKKITLPGALILGVLLLSAPLKAQRIEANIGLGYTAVDLNAWAGGAVSDWNQMLYHVGVQGYMGGDNVEFGAELAYTYFMWYTVPFFSGTREPSATSVSGLARFNMSEKFFTEVAAGLYFFGDWMDVGVRVSGGLKLPINDNIFIPLKISIGGVLDADANLYPVHFSGGVAYTF